MLADNSLLFKGVSRICTLHCILWNHVWAADLQQY